MLSTGTRGADSRGGAPAGQAAPAEAVSASEALDPRGAAGHGLPLL